MYYIIWNDIFSFFPIRFEMYISVAWFWNLYVIVWKCVWCVLLCCWGPFVFLLLCHHDNYKYQVCGYDSTLFIGQQHPITVYRTGFWVCVVLVLSVICVPLANPLMKLYFIMIIILCIISYETKFSHSFLFGLRCIFQLPGSGICIL